jgi:hypothetical protein
MNMTIKPVLGIRIRMFVGLPDPDPLVRGAEPDPAPDPSLYKKKKGVESGSGSMSQRYGSWGPDPHQNVTDP